MVLIELVGVMFGWSFYEAVALVVDALVDVDVLNPVLSSPPLFMN